MECLVVAARVELVDVQGLIYWKVEAHPRPSSSALVYMFLVWDWENMLMGCRNFGVRDVVGIRIVCCG